jgi:5-methylcytosine-specific restriction endonuclease McrA
VNGTRQSTINNRVSAYTVTYLGDTIDHYGHYFRGGRRGKRLEVDRMISDQPYSPENCVLACYPCNNAKSDVFTYEEFVEIGKTIGRVKIRPRI